MVNKLNLIKKFLKEIQKLKVKAREGKVEERKLQINCREYRFEIKFEFFKTSKVKWPIRENFYKWSFHTEMDELIS